MRHAYLRWLLPALLGLLRLSAAAQCYNPGYTPTPPTQYASWNWETPFGSTAYCDTWTSINKSGVRQQMGAPWVTPSSNTLKRISQTSDYKKTDGWEVVRLDFGGNGGTAVPNFILYNKYTGVMRVYAWLGLSQSFSKVIITMSHLAGSQSNAQVSAVAGLSQSVLRSPEKYLNSNLDDDVTTYICGYGGNNAWVMGEYTMLFDPNYADSKYYESSLQFTIYGIVSSTVTLAGDLRFTTVPQEDYGFAGKKSTINDPANLKKISATGTKYIGKLDKVTDQLKIIGSKSKETADNLGDGRGGALGVVQKASRFLANITGNGSDEKKPNIFKSILGVTGQLGGVFSLVGSVAGLIWPDDESAKSTPPTPTVSTGTISLKGSIETTQIVGQVITNVPGTGHSTTNSNTFTSQPYYNCPMGLFNLRRAPILNRVVYDRAIDRNGNRGQVPQESYTSYSVAEDLQPVVNGLAGVQVVSMKAAIVQKVRHSALKGGANDADAFGTTNSGQRRFNLLYALIMNGSLEANPYDNGATSAPEDDTYLVQTPFVDFACFKNVAYNAPTDSLAASPAFVRVVVVLRRTNAPTGAAPIYFTQDYAFDAIAPTYPPAGNGSYLDINDPTPYSNGYNTQYNPLDVAYYGTVFQQYGQFYSGPRYLIFANTSSLTMDLVRNGGSSGYGGGEGGFRAGMGIQFQGELNIPSGMNVYMTTDNRYSAGVCTATAQADVVTPSCSYNTQAAATRSAAPLAAAGPAAAGQLALRLAPNPAEHYTSVSLEGAAPGSGIRRVEILSLSGQLLRQLTPATNTTTAVDLSLLGFVPGLYVVRVTTADQSFTQKLAVQ